MTKHKMERNYFCEIGFMCQICGNSQSMGTGPLPNQLFPVCDPCKEVLREIIKERKSSPNIGK